MVPFPKRLLRLSIAVMRRDFSASPFGSRSSSPYCTLEDRRSSSMTPALIKRYPGSEIERRPTVAAFVSRVLSEVGLRNGTTTLLESRGSGQCGDVWADTSSWPARLPCASSFSAARPSRKKSKHSVPCKNYVIDCSCRPNGPQFRYVMLTSSIHGLRDKSKPASSLPVPVTEFHKL